MTKEEILKLEEFLMKEAEATKEDLLEAYEEGLDENETYEEWLIETAKVNGYKF